MISRILTAAALTSLAIAGTTQAATIFFSTTSTGDQPIANPVLNLEVGNTQTVYMWAKLNPDIDGEGTGEKVIGLGVDAISSQAPVAGASAWVTALPTRWQVNTAPAYGTPLFTGLALGAITTAGLDGSLASQGTAGSGQLRVGSFTVSANAQGTTNVFLRVGQQTVAYAAGQGDSASNNGSLIFFGAGDAGVPVAAIGSMSALPDLTINVTGGEIPEPATLGLASIAALGLLRRRRA